MDIESDQAFTQQTTSRNYAKFYPHWVRNNFRSKQEGQEVGEHQDFIMIVCPGQKDIVHRRATDEDKRQYPQEWASYKEGKEHRVSGTPIELLPGLDRGRADGLKALYIYSVEQLAELSDLARQKVGIGANELVQRAQQFLKRENPQVKELKEANEQLQWQNRELQDKLAQMQAQIDALAANQKKKPGRKKPANQPSVN